MTERAITLTAPALPEATEAGWHLVCLRCLEASEDRVNLSMALAAHARHRCHDGPEC